ncbi:hypothetical protein DPX16_18199 [Anabarilius grahami]|uniref:Uncharacterized protein n=1 Tax=Anabarilius grahami TaxID=495550 RepID=A0A3N0Y803_ANAGA|nr:hypothetical protein DPX16_18199 [Anabarilius grahami]
MQRDVEQRSFPDREYIQTELLGLIFTPDSMKTGRCGADAKQRHSRRTGEHRGSRRHTGDSTLVRECDNRDEPFRMERRENDFPHTATNVVGRDFNRNLT